MTNLHDNVTGSLRWAIDNAPTGSTITFDASLQGTLRLTANLLINKPLSIRGPGVGRLTIIGGDLSNEADSGGGIANAGGTLKLIDSTISDNRALDTYGGGILNATANAQVEMIFCTIYGNSGGEDGGGIWNGENNSASQVVMRNSLVADNTALAGPDILGPLTSQGYNLIQNTQDTKIDSHQAHGTDLLKMAASDLGMDPRLRNNNGPTQTHALLPGSVAIDRIPFSDCRIQDISTDQRGVRRPQGAACDIGAFETSQ